MSRIIAVTNQKGGVGKTTTTVNLAAGLAGAGKRVLLVDLDPQANATMGSGVDKNSLAHTVYDLLLGLADYPTVLAGSASGYSLLPANRELAGAEVELIQLEHREHRLTHALKPHLGCFDYVIVDCPPSLSLLTLNGLCLADEVIIPMQCEYYALEGLSDLVATLRKVRQRLNPRLEIAGLLRTMFDPRNTLAQQVSAQLDAHFGDKVFRTVVPRNIRLAEAPSYGQSALAFDRTSKGAQAYLALAAEMLQYSVNSTKVES